MKQILENPALISIEVALIQDIIKILANAIHPSFTHAQITSVTNQLGRETEKQLQEQQDAAHRKI